MSLPDPSKHSKNTETSPSNSKGSKPSNKRRRKYDCQVDIWSLGCIVFNLFTGVPPFYEPTTTELFNKIKSASWIDNVPDPYYFQEDDGSDAFAVVKETKRATLSLVNFFTLVFDPNPKTRIDSKELVLDKFIR